MSARDPLSDEDRAYLRKSRAASGVPEKVADSRAVERIAALVLNSETIRVMKTVKKSA
jgi:hypothetical protein